MKKCIFKGAGVAIVTPMKPDGSINYTKLGDIIEFQIKNKTDAIIVCGTTGESATMTHEERCKTIEYTVKKVAGRIPVIAGTGSNNTKYSVELSKFAQKAGVNGILVVTPYYNKTSQKGLINHFTHIADNVNIPIILYNVPSRTGCNIKPETYLELSKHPNIVATKEANGDISSIIKTMSLCDDNLDIYSGNDDQTAAIMSMGGIGVISVLSNICPLETHNLTQLCLDGNTKEASKLQKKYIKLIEALFSDVNPIPIKAAMNMLGYNCGRCRMPLDIMSNIGNENLKNTLIEYGLLK